MASKLFTSVFSDEWRRPALFVGLILMVLTMSLWVSDRTTVEVGYWACLEDIHSADGRDVVMSLFRVHEIVDDTHFVIEHGFREVPVVGESTGLHVGQIVSMGGQFRAEDRVIVETWRAFHTQRSLKVRYGMLGTLLLLFLLPVWFTVSGGRVHERAGRNHG